MSLRTGQRRSVKNFKVAGFTLLELLLATAMAAVLLLGIWSLFSMYTRLFEKGQNTAEQAQLVRALLKQLSDDLHAALQDPTPGQPQQPRGPVAVRRFALFGTEAELRFDVLQITPFGGSLTPTADAAGFSAVRGGSLQPAALKEPLRAPELRTVYYRFEPVANAAAEQPAGTSLPSATPGLSRRELDFETPYLADEAEIGGLSPADGPLSSTPSLGGDEKELMVVDPNDDSVMLAPEVVECRFRYFDGSSWSSQWNSLSRKSLPVAVEVTLEVSTLEDRQREFQRQQPDEPGLDEAAVPPAPASNAAVYPTYRLVIDIPGAPMHREPRKVSERAVAQLRERAATRYRPRVTPPRPRPSTERIDLSDQWMRTEQ
jgi:type II secretory pathway pseudopilin PulG